ncbi:MAG: 50S ribosomal protein L29 [Holosporales bacterium]|jgi:ribosomal protein L29|nr:50S ribosomal protein L29 [Holosporales bacterium]
MKFVDLLQKDAKELLRLCNDMKREYFNLRVLTKTTQDVRTSTIRSCRKNIARVKTRLSQLKD